MMNCSTATSRPIHYFGVLFAVTALFVLLAPKAARSEVTPSEKKQLKEKVIEMFNHAYSSYMNYAFPADELMPLSCKGRYRGSEPDRGDIDESLGNFSLTLVDTLDTLAVLGNITEFERAVKLVINNVKFDTDVVVSVFETNIRVLGGLLGAHAVTEVFKQHKNVMKWYNGELLHMAVDIADRLLVAFNTTTGIPYPRVNLLYGVHHPLSRIADETDTCTACAGTMIMEFAALSRMTGKHIYEEKAHKAMEAIWHFRSRNSDLVGTVINIHNGDWTRRDSGIGAGIDSYYEYCLKAYILLGDKSYLEKFNTHYVAINKYIKQGSMMLDVLMHQPDRPIRSFVDSLQAFWPGLQVLMGDLKPAIETHEMLYEVVKRHKFIPEAFTTNYDVYWVQHPLRPEFAESTYFLYEATKDPYYLEAGKHIVETLEQHARVPCGFAAIKDLTTFSHEDKMDSFVLAETFKYLYLLFSEDSERILNIHNFLFTTEAHLLPLSLSNVNLDRNDDYNQTIQNITRPTELITDKSDIQSTCPNNAQNKFSIREFARVIRKQYRKPVATPKCNPGNPELKFEQTLNANPNREPKIRAEHFQVGNTIHLQLLKEMGITVVQTSDGKVQLMHQAGTAATPEDATDGIRFMQDMIQIAKTKNPNQGVVRKPRIVQVLSPPYNGKVVFGAGAAQFGLDITDHIGLMGDVIESDPYNACNDIKNKDDLANKIVIAERGGCMFIDKVRRAQLHNALAVIIIDNNEGTSGDAQPVFAMSGDSHSEDVTIPSVFLFHKEGSVLKQYAKQSLDENGQALVVRLAGKAQTTDDKTPAAMNNSNKSETDKENSSSENVDSLEKGKSYDVERNEKDDMTKEEELDQASKIEERQNNVLDKMEESLERKPETITIQDGVVIETSTEKHVRRNADGKLVSFETTYTTYKRQDPKDMSTEIRVTSKEVPLESTSIDVSEEVLKNKPLPESDKTSDMSSKPDNQMGSKTQHFDEDLNEIKNIAKEGATDKGKKIDIGETGKMNRLPSDGSENNVRDGSIKPESIQLSNEEKTETDNKEIRTEQHSYSDIFVLQKDTSEPNMVNENTAAGIDNIGQESAPKNVICNSAGCFSSLEELEMFNGIALQARNNFQQMEAEQTSNKIKNSNQETIKSDDNNRDHLSSPGNR